MTCNGCLKVLGLHSLQELGGHGYKGSLSHFKYQWPQPTGPLWAACHHTSTSAGSFPTNFFLSTRALFRSSIIEASFLLQGFYRVSSLCLELLPPSLLGPATLLVIHVSAQMLPAHRDLPDTLIKETLPILAVPLPVLFSFSESIMIWKCLVLCSLTYCVSPQLELSATGQFNFFHGCILNKQQKNFSRGSNL